MNVSQPVAASDASAPAAPAAAARWSRRDSGKRRTSRTRRVLRRVARLLIVLLVVIGAWSTWRFFTGPPQVGHFPSAEARAEYLTSYDDAFTALPEPTATSDIATTYGTVRVYEWSTPQTRDTIPIVLLPGRASGVPMWAANLPDLAEHRRVIAFDALGDAGLSVQGTAFTSFDDQATWIEQVLDGLAPRGAHIVGHSFGGATAASYARHHPERVVTLTLLEPVFTFANPPAGMLAWTMVSTLPGLPDGAREYALGKVGGSEYDASDPMAVMIAQGTKHYAASLPQPSVLNPAQRAELTMPVYVAIGDHASLAGGSAAADVARTLPDAVVKVWPDTTHSLPMQVGPALNAELQAFFTSHDR